MSFYNGNTYINDFNYDFQYSFTQIIDLPFASDIFYDSIVIQSLTDKNAKLTYLKPLETDEEFDISKKIDWSIKQSALLGSKYSLEPHREYIDAITANLVSVSDDAITINVRNISGSNIQLLEFFEIGDNTMYHLNDYLLSKESFGKDTLITIPNADINFKEDYAIYYKYEEFEDTKVINVSLLSNVNTSIVPESGIAYQDFETYKTYFSEDNQVLGLISDHTVLSEQLNIPAGFIVVLNAGQSISFENDAFIRSYSPLNFNGTQDNPINISAV